MPGIPSSSRSVLLYREPHLSLELCERKHEISRKTSLKRVSDKSVNDVSASYDIGKLCTEDPISDIGGLVFGTAKCQKESR